MGDVTDCFTADAVIYDTNHAPVTGRETIGRFWAKIAAKWSGATWEVHTYLGDDEHAATEWSMHGQYGGRPFTVRGSEHYDFVDGRIAQIRQYWTFDPASPGSELIGFPYDEDPRFADGG